MESPQWKNIQTLNCNLHSTFMQKSILYCLTMRQYCPCAKIKRKAKLTRQKNLLSCSSAQRYKVLPVTGRSPVLKTKVSNSNVTETCKQVSLLPSVKWPVYRSVSSNITFKRYWHSKLKINYREFIFLLLCAGRNHVVLQSHLLNDAAICCHLKLGERYSVLSLPRTFCWS